MSWNERTEGPGTYRQTARSSESGGVMATSFSQTYIGPEHGETAYLTASARLLSTSRGSYEIGLTRVKFDDLWAAHAVENGPRIKHAHQTRKRAIMRYTPTPRESGACLFTRAKRPDSLCA